MYLSALKVNGFKSFADHTLLKFNRGVTAVVGPNGCGKSNIADSIRWVLGEQSAKALRGGKMQDVIFEGSDKRKPLNICEVAITLTDCEKELGSDFNEVEIARKVHRDGGSNYYINGKACRLKDIQRLFMDTGIGRTSYSIMAQGQIDQILSSKPEERRAVFEEAAGISRYKAQRKETLNKLAHVETNLARVTDVVAEIGRQIGSLKRQATKAIRYKKISHKLRHLDIGYSAYQYQTMSATLDSVDQSSSELQTELDGLAKDLESKEGSLIVYKEERQTLIQKVQDSQQSVFDLRSMKEQASNAADMAQIKIASLGERMEQATQEIASFEAQLGEIASKVDEHNSDKQMHLDVLGNSDEIFQERNRDLEEIEERLRVSETQIQQLRVAAQDAERASSRCREALSAIEVEAGTSRNRLMRLEEELAEQSEGQAEAAQSLSDFQERLLATRSMQEQLQADLESARDGVSEKRDAFKSAQISIQEIDRNVAQKSARVKLLQQLQEKLEGYGEGAKALLKGKLGGVLEGKAFAPLTSDLSVKDGYGPAVEALLGSAMEAVAVDDADTAIEIFQQLEDGKIGRACVQLQKATAASGPATDLPDWLKPATEFVSLKDDASHDSLRAVLASSYIVDSMADFLKWREGQTEFRFLQVASQKGETLDARGLVTGGFKGKVKNSSILQREVELKQTQKELEEEQKALEASRAEADKVNKELEAAEEAVESKRHEIAETNHELSSLQAEERNAQKLVQEQKMRAERLERERIGLEEVQAASTERLEAAKAMLAKEMERLESSRRQLEETEEGIGDIRGERDEKREGLSQAKYDLQEKKAKLDVITRGMVEMEQRRNELTRLIETKTRDIENWEEQSESLKSEIAQAEERSGSVDAELEEAKILVNTTREALVSIEERIGVLEREQNGLRIRVDDLRNNLGSQQVQIAEKRSRLEYIQEEITREYGQDLTKTDWKWQLWKARQPVEDLPVLDDDDEEEETSTVVALPDPDAEPQEEEDAESSEEAEPEADAETPEAEATDEEESEPEAVEPLSKQRAPTEAEREELEKTNWAAVKREVETLRKRIQSMGTVNTDAIAEYGELRERHGFLKGQYDDLVSSKEKLEEAIDEINTKSREQFTDTFVKIRENFKHTFSTLFHGGKADLQLIETDDVLESGIEIVAQPPGTKLKGVSLLSGGQKTMTAVGLLFAIYMVKPSPFCLLDELDAPLDESNIGRFTTLLKQFTKQSQFIIITHNKRTIAAAQAIYGVTMEEKGVSKVVSMKFHSEHEDPDMVKLDLDKPTEAVLA
ncbi:chromosome segregation protein SMC [Pelagicoccus sp. SDUM812002]|uniref:chromosome segregation protein SMC n=1 Tax=Pelagicoccus sp. SDUM812002 TaxID=3041266 RepID=UPI00280EF5FC|nr:chromosome segregation protein SMC [Pelagicoccus sp. SDUM812002]MDQ8188190.1 chromosome segregation protein SMC [Pelagicoccus sp. SDUM812002]